MMDSESKPDEILEPEVELASNERVRHSKTAGLREGISDGRDSTFQKCLDIGYQEGFKAGFAIGKYIAALQFSDEAEAGKSESLLQNPTIGWCELCSNPDANAKTSTISDLTDMQRNIVKQNLQTLFNRYEEKVGNGVL